MQSPRATDSGDKDEAAPPLSGYSGTVTSQRSAHMGRIRRSRITNTCCFRWHVGREGRGRAFSCERKRGGKGVMRDEVMREEVTTEGGRS